MKDLSSYLEDSEGLDLWANPIQPRKDDVIHGDFEAAQEQVNTNGRPITRSKAKKHQEALALLLKEGSAHLESLESKEMKLEPKLITLLICLEGQPSWALLHSY